MIAAGIFTIAGIICWGKVQIGPDYMAFALICWLVAVLCGAGVIK